jgi:hypothetical protein
MLGDLLTISELVDQRSIHFSGCFEVEIFNAGRQTAEVLLRPRLWRWPSGRVISGRTLMESPAE